MTGDWTGVLWDDTAVVEAFDALADAAGLSSLALGAVRFPPPLPPSTSRRAFLNLANPAIRQAARLRGVEAQAVVVEQQEWGEALDGTSLWVVIVDARPRLLVVLRTVGRRVHLLAPDRQIVRLDRDLLLAAMNRTQSKESDWQGRLLECFGMTEAHPAATRLLANFRSDNVVAQRRLLGWLLRLPAASSLDDLVKQEGLRAIFIRVLLLSAVGSLVTTGSLLSLGTSLITGRLDWGRLISWAMFLVMTVPIQMLLARTEGQLSIKISTLVKRRLFEGMLRLPMAEVRLAGMGELLGLVNEAQVLDDLGLNTTFLLLSACFDLITTGALFLISSNPLALMAILLASVVILIVAARLYYQRRRRWTRQRLGLTNDLVEKMVGHRTRIAQQSMAFWHQHEDELISSYKSDSVAMDRAALPLQLASRAFLASGFLAIFPAFIQGATASSIFIGVTALIIASQAIQKISQSLLTLSRFLIALSTVKPLLDAGQQAVHPNQAIVRPTPAHGEVPVLFDASHLTFRYTPQGRAVLSDCSLQMRYGEQILLEGGSGGGKTTLASILAGLRRPQSGILLLAGLDQYSLSPELWRSIVATAPQFQENHIFSASLAFNLLLARGWPAAPEDVDAAITLCLELGLGPLLSRMPDGLLQFVGEQGWQLSHGERSRIFIARAILQGSDLLILDESFGALDPETLELCISCVLRRVKSLIVIAHP